jgi:hypothetical protein
MPDSTTGSSSTGSDSADIFTNPSSDYWVDYPIRANQPSDPAFKLPSKNIGYFQKDIPSSAPSWRAYNPYQGTATTIPSNFDPVGWNCANCFFRLNDGARNLCTKYRFEIPIGNWRCNSFVTNKAKFTPFVSEQTPFANEDVLQLVDQQGRYLVDIYKFINVDPSGIYPFISGYHNKGSAYIPVFVLGSYRYSPLGTWYDYAPVVRSDWLPLQRSGGLNTGACIPMSLTEKPGWIQYDADPVTNNFTNLRFLPKDGQSLEFISIGSAEGFVVMMPKSIVDAFTIGGYNSLPFSFSYYLDWQFWFTLYRSSGPKTIFTSGDDLVSGKPVLDAFGEKSVPVVVNPDMFLADNVAPVPVKRESIAVTPVSTGLLGIPREETSLNLFEDINKIGLDTTRWIAKTSYQYESVEPQGWFDSYSVRNNPDLQVPEGALPYETAVRVESDIQNSGINLFCRVPPSSFPWHRYSAYGQTAYDVAKGKWNSTNTTFPPYGTPRTTGVTSSAELTSRQYFAYQPGRITGFTFGVRVCPPEYVGSSSEVSWGIENDENAMFFRLNNGTWSIVRSRFNYFNPFTKRWSTYRTETVSQGSFNGDNLNGFGDSGYVMKWDTVTMFKIEYGWYGGVGARLYAYVPVGNKAAKWVRIHDFGPPQSDSEPNTPADLKSKRYPTLSTPWFKVFYRLVSANGTVNDQGMLSLSKYGVSVYIDGGNPNSPQITDVSGGVKTIPAFNSQARTLIIPNLMNFSGQSAVSTNSVTVGLGNPAWGPAIQANPSNYEIVFNDGLTATITGASGTASPGAAWTLVGTWPANANGCPCTIQSKDFGLEKISSSDVFPVIATRYKTKMKKRLTADSIPGAATDTTNYKVIVPKRLSISATSSSTTNNYPLRVDMWTASGVSDTQSTIGKVISYPDGYNYSLSGLFPDANNSKNFFFKKNSNTPWWSYVPPCYLAPDWSQPSNGTFNLPEEEDNCPTRPTSVDPARRRYLLGADTSPNVYLRGGLVSGVSTDKDPNFFAMRVADAGALSPDPFSSLRDPYFYNFNLSPDTAELAKVGYTLNFKHTDMVMMSDPIFDPFFNFSYEVSGNVYAGFYYHKKSVASGQASAIMNSSSWADFVNSELEAGMWPLYFTPYSLHGAYGFFSEGTEGRTYTNQDFSATKYTFDNLPSSLLYNTSFTRIIGGASRGMESQNYIRNQAASGVHLVFLLSPGSSIKNVTVSTNPSTNDIEQRAVRFLGQPDSLYAGTTAHQVLQKIYGKSLIGSGTQFPARLTNETAYNWIKRIPLLSAQNNFSWGRPGIEAKVSGSSARLPATFRDQNENSGILVDTDCTQRLDTSKFELLGSFFISANKQTQVVQTPFLVSKEAYIEQNLPTTDSSEINFGALRVKYDSGGTNANNRKTYLQFNLASSVNISETASASLQLYFSNSTAHRVNLYALTQPYEAMSSNLIWNTAYGNDTTSAGMVFSVATLIESKLLVPASSAPFGSVTFTIPNIGAYVKGNKQITFVVAGAANITGDSVLNASQGAQFSLNSSTLTLPVIEKVITKPFNFSLNNFFSYSGTAIRGPGDYTFFVTAKNMTSVENSGLPITVTASVQCEEG